MNMPSFRPSQSSTIHSLRWTSKPEVFYGHSFCRPQKVQARPISTSRPALRHAYEPPDRTFMQMMWSDGKLRGDLSPMRQRVLRLRGAGVMPSVSQQRN